MALIVLVSMTVAAIALVRSVDTGVLAAANLALRQSATMAGENGLRAGTNWLLGFNNLDPALLYDNDNNAGYWANAQNAPPTPFSPLTYDWEAAGLSVCANANCAPDVAGNVVRYVIHRLCDAAGNPLVTNCVRAPVSSGTTEGHSAVNYRNLYPTSNAAGGLGGVLYRVSVRITGPRNTTSYIQAVLF
jgi:hypothetical protein